MPRESKLYNGFVSHDYILTFEIADPESRTKLVELCRGPWQGDEVTASTWEITSPLDPYQMESKVLELLREEDRVVYYYLSDSKRIFRVILTG